MPTTTRVINRLYIALISLVGLLGALLGAFFIATAISNNESDCINRTLGERNPITQADAQAHTAFGVAIAQASSLSQVRKAGEQYAARVAANQKQRDLHPLGHC